MKSPVLSFHYSAHVSDADIKVGEVSVDARAIEDQKELPLAGTHPRIRFFEDRMVLVSAPSYSSLLKWCSFRVGDVLWRAVSVGDRIVVRRDVLDAVTVCLFRNERLLVAVGALSNEDLGSEVNVTSDGGRQPGMRFEIDVAGRHRVLGARESATVDMYDIYVDFAGDRNMYGEGPCESISIAPADDLIIVNSARRSAVLMASQNIDPLCGERIDGTMIKNRYQIG